ncbi:MAG: hypothetical protein NT139_00175 [Candidatus Woesearchaeota archaeon]|jgi:vacuolar-type H+-ATPase subunit I/STV1|nr:hypothetical protein [Candidatus Woesearchaeota archaeon]
MLKIRFVKQFVKDAIISFFYWTLILTPYMVFVVKTNLQQYIAWVGMQAILVPPLGAVFSIIARKLKSK